MARRTRPRIILCRPGARDAEERVAVLHVQPPGGHALSRELTVHVLPVRVGVDGTVVHALGEEQRIGFGVGHPLGVPQATPPGGVKRVRHAGLGHPECPRHRVLCLVK